MAQLSILSNNLRVLAADSTSMGTQLLVEALGRERQFQMIQSPSAGAALLALVKQEKPHVAVVSAKLGQNCDAYDVVREIRQQSAATRVIVLLDASERGPVTEAFRAGAHGVFCRTEPFDLLAKCIQCVHQGQVWANGNELQFLLEALSRPKFEKFYSPNGTLLSARETDVVRCLADGLTNREIAQRLKLTEHTVKNYLFRIFDKLGVSSRVEVVLYALGSSVPQAFVSPARGRAQSLKVSPRSAGAVPVAIRKTAT